MNIPSENAINQLPTSQVTGCPHLGVLADPQTRVACADASNYCHLVKPAKPVLLPHQEAFCLSNNFPLCEVYKKGAKSTSNKRRRKNGKEEKVVKSKQLASVSTLHDKMNTNSNAGGGLQNPNQSEAPQDGAEVWARLHQEAVNHYDQSAPSENKWVWTAILVVAMLVLGVSIFGAYRKFNQLKDESKREAETSRVVALVTSAFRTLIAENATATANMLLTEARQLFASPTLIATATQNPIVQETPAAPNTPVPVAGVDNRSCQDVTTYSYEIESGPKLNPEVGTIYIEGGKLGTVEASWIIKNTGPCEWIQLALLSTSSGKLITPVIRFNGELVPAVTSSGQSVLTPGSTFEVILVYNPENVVNIHSEWVLVVNGFELSNQSRIVLNVDNWIIKISSTPTEGKGKPKSTSDHPPKPTSTKPPTSTSPASRPTQTPEPRPTR